MDVHPISSPGHHLIRILILRLHLPLSLVYPGPFYPVHPVALYIQLDEQLTLPFRLPRHVHSHAPDLPFGTCRTNLDTGAHICSNGAALAENIRDIPPCTAGCSPCQYLRRSCRAHTNPFHSWSSLTSASYRQPRKSCQGSDISVCPLSRSAFTLPASSPQFKKTRTVTSGKPCPGELYVNLPKYQYIEPQKVRKWDR